MRIAGITQINNYISLFSEYSQNDTPNALQRQLESHHEELTEWILSNRIIEHIFGPNLHVEVIKQSQIVLNFIVARITPEHVDTIWSAAQLKHCSKQVLDLLTQLVKNMSIASVLHLYSLLRRIEPKDHSEQTLCLASGILKYIWTKALNIPVEQAANISGGMKLGAPLSELGANLVKSPIFTMLPARGDDDHSSTSASMGSEDEDVEFDATEIAPTKTVQRLSVDEDYDSSWASNSSSNEEVDVKLKEQRKALKLQRKLRKRQGVSVQKLDRKSESESESDEDGAEMNVSPTGFNEGIAQPSVYGINSQLLERQNSPVNTIMAKAVEVNESCDETMNGSKKDESSIVPSEGQDESLLSDSNNSCRSSHVSQSSLKNMQDFEGESDSDITSLSPSQLRAKKRQMAANLKSAFDKSSHDAKATLPNGEVQGASADLAKFTIENLCKPDQTLLWDLLQDGAIDQLAEGLAVDCEKVLCNLICWLADRRIRMKFIEGNSTLFALRFRCLTTNGVLAGCLENLENNRSVIVSLRLLPKLFMSFQQYRGGPDIHKVTLWADQDRRMLKHFFANLLLHTSKQHTSKLYNHTEEMQTRLQFLSFVFSAAGSPENFKLTLEQMDILWNCLANDSGCRDELFNWLLNQIRVRDQHALGTELLHYILKEKMPLLKPENFTMIALELLQHLCGSILSHSNQDDEITTVAIKQLWDIALTTTNTDVSMAAIKHLNNYYIHLQNINKVPLDKEEEFIEECMDYLKTSSSKLAEDEERHSTIIQRALTLLKTHLEVFRCRYSYHLRKMQLSGDISIVPHRAKAVERASLQMLRISCHPAPISDKMQFEMQSTDFVGELRAEITHWWTNVIGKCKAELVTSVPVDGPIRLLSHGKELHHEDDEKTLAEFGIKDMSIVFLSIGAQNRQQKRSRDAIEPASLLPPPPKDKLPMTLLLKQSYFEQLFSLTQRLGSMKGTSHIRAQVLSRRVWDIIQILPTSPDLLNRFNEITSTAEDDSAMDTSSTSQQQSMSFVFNSLLSPNSPQKLIYSVQIVEWLRRTSKKEDNWSKRFVECGGLQHIFDIFVSGVLQQTDSESSWNEWKQDCLASLLQLIYQFGITNPLTKDAKPDVPTVTHEVEPIVKKKQRRKGSIDKLLVHQFNNKLLSMLNDVDSMLRVLLTILQEATSRTNDVNCYQTGFWGRAQVIHHTITFLTSWMFSDVQVHKSLFQWPTVNNLLKRLVLDDPDPAVRREACSGFYRMCLGFTPAGKKGLMFIPPLLNSLLTFLSVAQSMRAPKATENEDIAFVEKEPYGPGCKDYFWLVCRLVDSLDRQTMDEHGNVNFDKLCTYIAEAIVKREIRESRQTNAEDEGLRGLLSLMTMSLKHNPPFKNSTEGRKFMTDIFEALFKLPNQAARNLPKCKAQSTRSTAFDLLVEFAKGCESNLAALITLLKEQHDSNSHTPYPWDFWPHDDCRYDSVTV